MAEAVHVPAHLVPTGSPQPKHQCHLHVQPSLGQSCPRQKEKKSWVYALKVASVCNPVDCGLPGFSQGDSLGKNTGAYWLILVAIAFQSTIFPAALASSAPAYLVLPEPLRPKQLHYLHNRPSQGQTHFFKGSLRSKPQWMTHMQRCK